MIQELVKSASGVVWKAQDKLTHQPAALKRIFGEFRNLTDAQRIYWMSHRTMSISSGGPVVVRRF
jgi:hypothetical protein